MRRRKRVVDIDIAQGRHRAGQLRVVLFLARVKPGVFQQQHLASCHALPPRALAASPMQSSAKTTGAPSAACSAGSTWRRLISGTTLPLGRPKCASNTGLPPFARMSSTVGTIFSIRVASVTTPAFHRHVDIDPHQHHLARQRRCRPAFSRPSPPPVMRFAPCFAPVAHVSSTDHASFALSLRRPAPLGCARQIQGDSAMAEIKDPENTIIMTLKDGEVVIELLPDVAPKHVERMKTLARAKAYDNVVLSPRDRRLHGPDRRCRKRQHGKQLQPAPRGHGRLRPSRSAGRVFQASRMRVAASVRRARPARIRPTASSSSTSRTTIS